MRGKFGTRYWPVVWTPNLLILIKINDFFFGKKIERERAFFPCKKLVERPRNL